MLYNKKWKGTQIVMDMQWIMGATGSFSWRLAKAGGTFEKNGRTEEKWNTAGHAGGIHLSQMRDTSGVGFAKYGIKLSQMRQLGHKSKPEKAGSGSDAADGWRPVDVVLRKRWLIRQRADNESVIFIIKYIINTKKKEA